MLQVVGLTVLAEWWIDGADPTVSLRRTLMLMVMLSSMCLSPSPPPPPRLVDSTLQAD